MTRLNTKGLVVF
nr:unnamed protein product [Callosobruchus analis]